MLKALEQPYDTTTLESSLPPEQSIAPPTNPLNQPLNDPLSPPSTPTPPAIIESGTPASPEPVQKKGN